MFHPKWQAALFRVNDSLALARNTILPPVALQRSLFPCVEEYAKGSERYADWLQWTENLMLDKDMYYNRPAETRMLFPRRMFD